MLSVNWFALSLRGVVLASCEDSRAATKKSRWIYSVFFHRSSPFNISLFFFWFMGLLHTLFHHTWAFVARLYPFFHDSGGCCTRPIYLKKIASAKSRLGWAKLLLTRVCHNSFEWLHLFFSALLWPLISWTHHFSRSQQRNQQSRLPWTEIWRSSLGNRRISNQKASHGRGEGEGDKD